MRAQSPSWKDSFLVQHRSPHMTVLWVDRAIHQPFQSKQGVGLARKIGCDLLCRFHSENKLLSPWLFTTDADATLPQTILKCPRRWQLLFTFRTVTTTLGSRGAKRSFFTKSIFVIIFGTSLGPFAICLSHHRKLLSNKS